LETLTALVEQVSEPAERARLEAERVRLLDQRAQQASDLCVRRVTGLVPPVLTLAAAGAGAVIAWRQLQHNREQLQETLRAGQRERALTRSAQLAERFTRAVNELGKTGPEHLDVAWTASTRWSRSPKTISPRANRFIVELSPRC